MNCHLKEAFLVPLETMICAGQGEGQDQPDEAYSDGNDTSGTIPKTAGSSTPSLNHP